MAQKGFLGRAVLLVIIDIILFIGMLVWFDFLGVWDLKSAFAPAYVLVGITPRSSQLPSSTSMLLEAEREKKQLESFELKNQEQAKRDEDLNKREKEITQKAEELDQREKALNDQEKSLSLKLKEYDERKLNVEQNARYLIGMDPKKAVPILVAMDDQNVIDTMRMVETISKKEGNDSIVPYWLSLMPSDRAAAIQRKMAEKPLNID